MRIVERLLEAARVLTGEHVLPFNELDRLVEETEGAARATLLAALLDGRSNEDLGDELDGVLLDVRPRPRRLRPTGCRGSRACTWRSRVRRFAGRGFRGAGFLRVLLSAGSKPLWGGRLHSCATA